MSDTLTANQIARAAGITRQAVAARLGSGEHCFSSLPIEWQMEITRRAIARGFENAEQFLANLPAPWKCPIPWAEASGAHQAKAVKLQKALGRALEASANGMKGAELEALGMEDYKQVFGYPLKDSRHWRRLFKRTIERDASEGNWQRLEIYLDERAFAKRKPRREALRTQYAHRDLDEVLEALENRQNPTNADLSFLWDAAFHHFEKLSEQEPAGARAIKTSLLSYLFKAVPGMCGTEKGLRNRFEEKLTRWRNGDRCPEALLDQRSLRSGNFSKQDFSEDIKKIRNQAIQLDGSESLAYRMLRERGELSEAFCNHYEFNARAAKSALPSGIREAITPEVEMTLPLRRGAWQARMRGPHTPRDWSSVRPGDWFCADDVTWNHYFRERLPDGRWKMTRGECLLMIDLRTGYPLDFLLVPDRYNGEHVRSLVLGVHDSVGLPRKGFYFEKGVWASRLVTGDNRRGTPVHWREAENGLCKAELKLHVRHATTPRAKPIEGLLRIVQERMRCIVGFVGFNEREYDAERLQSLKARAERGDQEATAQFPTKEQWRDKISDVLEEYKHDPQNGKMLEGISPAEAWAEEMRESIKGGRVLKKLPPQARWILSTHQKTVRVRQEGILLTIRGKKHLYFNEHTGPLIGREVLAFYNLEMPEMLTVSDLERKNYFSVHRVELPAMDATPEQLQEVNRLRTAHMAPAKAIFGELKHESVVTIARDADHSEEDRELGRFHNEETAKESSAQKARTRKLQRLRVKAAASGIAVSPFVRNPERVETAIDRAKEYRERIEREESQNHQK